MSRLFVQPPFMSGPGIPMSIFRDMDEIHPSEEALWSGFEGGVDSPIMGEYNNPTHSSGEFDTLHSAHVTEDSGECGGSPPIEFSSPDALYSWILARFAHKARAGRPTLYHLHKLLHLCATERDVDLAFRVIQKFRDAAIPTTTETLSLLIKACCRAHAPHRGLDAVLRHRVLGTGTPSLKGLHYLMINFAINGDLPSLFKTLETLRGSGLEPNSRTYHIIIRACVDNGDVFHAVELLLDAKENRISLERGTYNVCMNGIIKELRELPGDGAREEKGRCLEEVKKLMDCAFIEPNGSTLALMVEGYMLLSDTAHAMDTLAELIGLLHGGVSDELAEAVVSYCERADAAEIRTCGQKVLEAAEKNGVALPASMRTALA